MNGNAAPKRSINAANTIFNLNGNLDLDGQINHLRWQWKQGTAAYFILGKMGEFPDIDYDRKTALINAVSYECQRYGFPLLVGVTANTLDETLRLVDYTKNLPLTGVVIQPSAIKDLSDAQGLINEISSMTPQSLYAYVNSKYRLTDAELLTTSVVKQLGDKLTGLKVTVESNDTMAEYIDALKGSEVAIYCGNHKNFFYFDKPGLSGAVTGLSNVFPGEYVLACRAYEKGEYDQMVNYATNPLMFLYAAEKVKIPMQYALKLALEQKKKISSATDSNGTMHINSGKFMQLWNNISNYLT